ncbi:hypothetical protein BGY98DRAFT_1181252, partial [Russula aff. rugulosa BPL654]
MTKGDENETHAKSYEQTGRLLRYKQCAYKSSPNVEREGGGGVGVDGDTEKRTQDVEKNCKKRMGEGSPSSLPLCHPDYHPYNERRHVASRLGYTAQQPPPSPTTSAPFTTDYYKVQTVSSCMNLGWLWCRPLRRRHYGRGGRSPHAAPELDSISLPDTTILALDPAALDTLVIFEDIHLLGNRERPQSLQLEYPHNMFALELIESLLYSPTITNSSASPSSYSYYNTTSSTCSSNALRALRFPPCPPRHPCCLPLAQALSSSFAVSGSVTMPWQPTVAPATSLAHTSPPSSLLYSIRPQAPGYLTSRPV